MRLAFDDPFREMRFRRELPEDTIREENGTQVFCEKIADPLLKIVPLFRCYSPWLIPENTECKAAKRIREGLLEMKKALSGEEKV